MLYQFLTLLILAGTKLPSKATNTNTMCENVTQFSAVQSTSSTALHGSSVAKSLFRGPHHSQSPCPKTPPQALPSQNSVSPLESSSFAPSVNSNTSQKITTHYPTTSSKILVKSPFKRTSCNSTNGKNSVSYSPLKSSQKRLNKRDHIKGRLDFDNSNVPLGLENVKISTLDNVDEMSEIFDIDLSTFNAFGTDFSLSEMLDIDLETEEMSPSFQQRVNPSTDLITGYYYYFIFIILPSATSSIFC